MNIKESITLGLIWHYLTIESKHDFYYRYMQLIRNINNIKNVTNQSWWVKKQSNMSTPVTTYFCQCKGAANQKLLCWVLASVLSAGKWSWKPQKWILQCMRPSWTAPLSHKAKQVFAGVSTFFCNVTGAITAAISLSPTFSFYFTSFYPKKHTTCHGQHDWSK